MTSGMLQEPLQTQASGSAPRFRPFASSKHQVVKGRYITSNDPRGYIPVYEYPLNGQWIMMDIDDGYILWTGIWKALGNSKADIVKMIDSQPDLAPLIRRVRGGYLKIQGTWMPYEVALRLSRRVAWAIREDLVPLFGPTFPSTCLSPDQPGYGQVVASGNTRRRARRNTQPTTPIPQLSREPNNPSWNVATPNPRASTPGASHRSLTSSSPSHGYLSHPHPRPERYQLLHSLPGPSSSLRHEHAAPNVAVMRYSPYASYPARGSPPISGTDVNSSRPEAERITLAPLRTPAVDQGSKISPYALPPIAALEDLRGIHNNDSAAVLRRLQSDDESLIHPHHHSRKISDDDSERSWTRRHSLAAHPYQRPAEMSPKRHTSSLPACSYTSHFYYDYNGQQRIRGSSRPSSRACTDRINLDTTSEPGHRDYQKRYDERSDERPTAPSLSYNSIEARHQPLRPW
ncbi:hypothetical protein Agabi119p4_5298 [Agaricus bisporus var. burnettii]|uniref:HTH APSES-type domain-containing protein n=1 Tax=Agaricus bisporus var. burnettii TaxID=192524 RepID=A0A8H7F1D9_AGABI|nr:hypothetical protein Agabi119p4_5298 [Agaricus bisporus var. burnettii]